MWIEMSESQHWLGELQLLIKRVFSKQFTCESSSFVFLTNLQQVGRSVLNYKDSSTRLVFTLTVGWVLQYVKEAPQDRSLPKFQSFWP